MIIFADNIISVVSDLEGKESSATEDLEGNESSATEDLEGNESSSTEDESSSTEDLDGNKSSVDAQRSASGEAQQTVVPNIVNDIVVPDNSYSKYCFFFLMLLFALFVGRSFRKGV